MLGCGGGVCLDMESRSRPSGSGSERPPTHRAWTAPAMPDRQPPLCSWQPTYTPPAGPGSSGIGGLWVGLPERNVQLLGRKAGKAGIRGLREARGTGVSLEGLCPETVRRRPLASPPPLGGDLSLPAPSRRRRRRRLPLVWPGRPGPHPRPAPARSLPSRRRGRGRGPGRPAPGSARPLPLPARQLSARPARLPRAASAEGPLPPLPGR